MRMTKPKAQTLTRIKAIFFAGCDATDYLKRIVVYTVPPTNHFSKKQFEALRIQLKQLNNCNIELVAVIVANVKLLPRGGTA